MLMKTAETIEKLIISHKGKPSPSKGIKRPNLSGKNNPSWKGGITKLTQKIRNSIEYKEWRTMVFKRDSFTCQDCGEIGTNLNAHHIIPFSEFGLKNYKQANKLSNLVSLCASCHAKITNGSEMGKV